MFFRRMTSSRLNGTKEDVEVLKSRMEESKCCEPSWGRHSRPGLSLSLWVWAKVGPALLWPLLWELAAANSHNHLLACAQGLL